MTSSQSAPLLPNASALSASGNNNDDSLGASANPNNHTSFAGSGDFSGNFSMAASGEQNDGSVTINPGEEAKAEASQVKATRTWGEWLFPSLGSKVTFWQQGPVDLISWFLTLACFIAPMVKDPADIDGSNQRDVIIRCIEIGLAVYFMVEWVLRATFLGLGDGTARHFRWLDFIFSAACATFHILFFAGVGAFNIELLVARSIRLFRPFVVVTNMPAVRVFLTSMTRAVIRGASVIVLFIFFLGWFSVAGGYEFGGSLHARCVSDAFFENNTNISTFVTEQKLVVQDFICGSDFFQFIHNHQNKTGYDDLMNLSYTDTFFNSLSCSTSQTCVYPQSVPTYGGFQCPFAYRCLQVGDNPYYNVIGFDNVAQAGLSLFVSNTFQVWYELEGWIADTGDPGAHFFFLILILIGGFMIVNVTTVILSIEFEQSMTEEKRSIVEQLSGIAASRAALQNVVKTMQASKAKQKRRREVRAKSSMGSKGGGGGDGDDDSKENSPEGGNDDKPGGLAGLVMAAAAGNAGGGGGKKKKHKQKKGEQPSLFDWQDTSAWNEADAANPILAANGGAGVLAYEEEMKSLGPGGGGGSGGGDTKSSFAAPAKPKMHWQEFLKKRIVKTKLFQLATGLVVFINCILMALDVYGLSEAEKTTLYRFDIFFTAFYVFEYMVRFAADGFKALKKASLQLDLLIVVLSIVDLALAEANFPGVRAFRVVRLVKLLKFFPNLYEWIILVAVAIKSSPVLLIVMAVLISAFACICMPLFGGRFCGLDIGDVHLESAWTPDREILETTYANQTLYLDPVTKSCFGRPRATFDTLGDALVSSYQISTADDWDLIMFDAMRARGWWVAILFLIYFYAMTYLVLSQIIAVLLTANKQQEDLSAFEDSSAAGEDALKKLEKAESEAKAAEKKKREEELAALEAAEEDAKKAKGNSDDDDEDESDDDDDEEDAASEASASAASSGGGGGGAKAVAARAKKRILEKKRKSKKKKSKPVLTQFIDCFFAVSDRTKEIAQKICANDKFLWFMSIVIIVGSLSMAFETPDLAPDSPTTLFLFDLDVVITSLYVFELVLNVHAYGLIRRETSYLQRDPWNVMDALLVLISVAGLFSTSVRGNPILRVMRALRAIRPLRVVKRSPGMRLVLSSLIESAAQMMNVFVLSFIFFFVFAIVGMQFFSGYLRRCYIGAEKFENLPLANCTALNGTYTHAPGEPNFDNIGTSFAALFLVATLENWAELMYRMMDSPGPEMPPERGSNPIAAPFFIASSFLLGYFIAGFFVSVLIDSYNAQKRAASLTKSLLVLREQEAWLMTAKRISRVLPHDDRHIKYDDDSWSASLNRKLFEYRSTARQLVESKFFQNSVNFFVLANFIMMGAITYPQLPYVFIIEFCDNIFVFLWVAEAIIKIYALKWRTYQMSTWNRLDFAIALVSLLSYILSPFINKRALSLVRVVRVVRLLRVVRRYTKVTTLLRMMGRAFVSLGHVLTFIFLIFFIFGVCGMNLFGRVDMQDRHANFKTLGSSLFLLLRITLGGNWIDLFMKCAAIAPFCEADIGQCGMASPVPQLFFYLFLFLGTFILKNLFTAVMLDAFTSAGNLRSIGSEDAKGLYEVWKKFDEDETFMIHPFDTLPLLREIPAGENSLLGFAHESRRVRVGKEFKFLIALKMLHVHEPVSIERFVDTLLGFSYPVEMPENAPLAIVREGSAHFIHPDVVAKWELAFKETGDDIKTFCSGIWDVTKKLYGEFSKASRRICSDLAGLEPPKEEEQKKEDLDEKNASEMKEVNATAAATAAAGGGSGLRRQSSFALGAGGSNSGNSGENSLAASRNPNNRRFSLSAGYVSPFGGGGAGDEKQKQDDKKGGGRQAQERTAQEAANAQTMTLPGEDEGELTDSDLFARTASYVMINTLIMRKRQLMREQIKLNERIALRRFDQMGLRGMQKASKSDGGVVAAAVTPTSSVPPLVTSAAKASAAAAAGGGDPLAQSTSTSIFNQQPRQSLTPQSLENPGGGGHHHPSVAAVLQENNLATLAGTYQAPSAHTAHHDADWYGSRPDAMSSKELAAKKGFSASSSALSPSGGSSSPPGSPGSRFGLSGSASSPITIAPSNPESQFFNSVCSYFATDERGIFSENSTTTAANNLRNSNSKGIFLDDEDENDNNNNNNSNSSPSKALSYEDVPSLLANILALVDDLYSLANHSIAHDSFNHSIDLARCFVELEWWSEVMCEAVKSLPEEHRGVDVAIALLPRNAGMQALMNLHDDIGDSIDRMKSHYSAIAKSDARLEHDWFEAWMQSDGKPFEEAFGQRFPEQFQGKSESVFVPLLAKSLPTLELIARLSHSELTSDKCVDAAILFQAADTALRRNAVWTQIVPKKKSSTSGSGWELEAHCDPEYARIFTDAVKQSISMANPSSSPRWRDVITRVGSRAASSDSISTMVPPDVKQHLKNMRSLFDNYLEEHRSLTTWAESSLDKLAEMRLLDLEENQQLVARQDHQIQQLRLCLQLLEQTYSDRSADGEPSAGLQFDDNLSDASQHPKKSTVVNCIVHSILEASERASKTGSQIQHRSGAYDVAHAAELTHDCARKALHSLLENIPRDPEDDSLSAFVRSHHGGGVMSEEPIGSAQFASECLTAVSRLATAVASEPVREDAKALRSRKGGSRNSPGGQQKDGEDPDAASSRLQDVVSAATGPEFRSKLNLLVESGVTAYVLRAMPHIAEKQNSGVRDQKNVGISQLAVIPQHAISPPKRLYLRLSRSMEQFEMRQASGGSSTSSIVARIPLGSILRIDGDTIGAAQAFGRSATNAWPFLGTALQGSRVLRFIVDTRKFSSRSKASTASGGSSATPDVTLGPGGSSAAAPLSLMMPMGEGHDTVAVGHERSIVIALPGSIIYGEWLSLLRDIVRHRSLLPILYASRAEEIRQEVAEEDKFFKWKSAVRTISATNMLANAFGGGTNSGSNTPTNPSSFASASSSSSSSPNNNNNYNNNSFASAASVSNYSSSPTNASGGGGGDVPLANAFLRKARSPSSNSPSSSPVMNKNITQSEFNSNTTTSSNNNNNFSGIQDAKAAAAAAAFFDI